MATTWKVYHQATVLPFSATLEGECPDRKTAEELARSIDKPGRVQVVNPKGFTVESRGAVVPV